MTTKTLSGLAAAALVSLAGTSALAQFESRWAGTGDFAYRGLDVLTVRASATRAYVTAGCPLTPGTAGPLDLSYWDSAGVQDGLSRRLWRPAGAGSWIDARVVHEAANGDILVAGRCYDTAAGAGALIARFDSNLSLVWNKSHYHDDASDPRIAMTELSNGRVVLSTPTTASLHGSSQLAGFPASGTGTYWLRVFTTAGGARLRITDMKEDGSGTLYCVGTLTQPPTNSQHAFLLTLDATASLAPIDLWTYDDPSAAESHFTGLAFEVPGQDVYLTGYTRTGSTIQTRIVKVDRSNLSSVRADIRYTTDMIPSSGGTHYRNSFFYGNGAMSPTIVVTGTAAGSPVARSMMLDAFGLLAGSVSDFGGGSPVETTFASGGVQAPGWVVSAGTYRPTAAGPTEALIIKQHPFGGTNCSAQSAPSGTAVATVSQHLTAIDATLPVNVMIIAPRNIVQEAVTINLPTGPYCGTRQCIIDFNDDGNADQDDVLALINVVGGGDCP
ncbi:MAG: hypothetical protein DYG92_13575 [Leptolyngbya sp. PLA1]|nr:hypothetical protein [Leptolyngbya sp. PLA1]